MAQSVKHLLSKQEDLSVVPHIHVRFQAQQWHMPKILGLGR